MFRRCVGNVLGKLSLGRHHATACNLQSPSWVSHPAISGAPARLLQDASQVRSALAPSSSIGRTLLDLQLRQLSSAAAAGPGSEQDVPKEEGKAGTAGAQGTKEAAAAASSEGQQSDLQNGEEFVKLEQLLKDKIAEVEEYKEKFARALADMENLRERTARAAERSKQFAIGDFVDDLLDVADTLERAVQSVPEEVVKEGRDPETGEPISAERALSILRSFVEGIKLTYNTLDKVFAKHGVYKIVPKVGDRLDPTQHEAVFDIPDASKEPGTIAVVMKKGYSLNGRVIRPAEVGAVRKVT